MTKPTVGLVMMVKNDAEQLERCLLSVLAADLIDTWTICDTGSTDQTRDVAQSLLGHLPGKVYRHKWKDFGHNRTLAYRRAQGSAEWLLRLDADFTVRSVPNMKEWLAENPEPTVDGWWVEVYDGGELFRLPLLLRGDQTWREVGKTHEYLDHSARNLMNLIGLVVTHHADGSSREKKFRRDLALLKEGVKAGDPRSTFYAAECHRFLGNTVTAIRLYNKRAAMPGFEEEAWYAQYRSAELQGSTALLRLAWHRRPWRHEPLTAMARIVGADPRAAGDVLWHQPVP